MPDGTTEAIRRISSVLLQIAARLEAEVAALVAELDTKGGVLENTAHNASNIARIRQQVADVAEREGVPRVVEMLRQELPEVVRQVMAQHPVPAEFSVDVTRELLTVLQGQEQEIAAAIVDGASSEVAAAMRHAVSGAVDVRTLQARVSRALDTSLGRAAVALDRAVREMGDRALVAAGAEASELLDADEFVYVYEGPDDAVTRPYCDARVGRYLTADQARALEPRERFNCRHVPTPRLLSEVIAEGVQPFEG